MLGFFTEQMLLSYISIIGCPSAGPEFAGQLTSVFFQTKTPVVLFHMAGSFFYIPTSFNFKGVDVILISVTQDKQEAVIRLRYHKLTQIRRENSSSTGNGGKTFSEV
ncbi:hypothetical protein L211DRAFT_338898 [Terfezia boudieri ATCC MYA-4762]|uniref:Uncharacterized protein n=1 Tax=Terfezia boudieri ATCC MYA-4762 TaxID=1051890 RepID=A0A3N4LI76_9PEZI|nr:hypothetical protein L211DRAFT_338898 [Terfezia boudieri ATCC MYA-4762]